MRYNPIAFPSQTEENVGEWERLLAERPEVAERFTRWDLLGGFAWARILSRRPEFADKCDWRKLKPMAWRQLLLRQPQFAAKYGAGDRSAKDIVAEIEANLMSKNKQLQQPTIRPSGRANR